MHEVNRRATTGAARSQLLHPV